MNFRELYIRNEIRNGVKTIEDLCGVDDNIRLQWKECNKAFGMFNDKMYVFGTTTDFSVDHLYIIDEMERIIGTSRFRLSVDRSRTGVSVSIAPTHRGIIPEGDFERSIIREILAECIKAFSERPEGTNIRVDIEPELLDSDDSQLTRSTNIDGIKQQIEHIRK